MENYDYDYIVIGSGFGGSVSALRLAEKGYRVLVLEKGKWLKKDDFPKTNWSIKKWLWMPVFRFHGLFSLSFFRHVTILGGVGVGGGSLVYANTIPVPDSPFFKADTWSHLADWEAELKDFYTLALKMRGAAPCPRMEAGDTALKQLAAQMGKEDQFQQTTVGV
jgi:cholesterol oxidase